MKTTLISPTTWQLLQAIDPPPDSPPTARKSPDMHVSETLSSMMKDADDEAVYLEGLNNSFLPLYRQSLHTLSSLHLRPFWQVAAAHDLYWASLAVAKLNSKEFGSREYSHAWADWVGLGEILAKDLAAERSWIFSRSHFSVSRLLKMRPNRYGGQHDCDRLAFGYIDHAQYFRHSTKPYRPAAILTHSYKPAEQVELYAAAFGLNCEFLEYSWYYPRKCVAALLMPVGA